MPCEGIPNSEEYAEFIINYVGENERVTEIFGGECFQRISASYGTIYRALPDVGALSIRNYNYGSIPALYGLMEENIAASYDELNQALESAGILKLQNQPAVNLKGQGCIIGFIDTGINIEDSEFRFSNGESRIIRIWDMSDETGTPPQGISYGSEYDKEYIDNILQTANDAGKGVVPYIGHDDYNHGNVLAKMATGNSGAAPEANIVVVKLKEAKKYLKDYYYIKDGVVAYQENDIILAINYIRYLGIILKMPISICLALGTNSRSHDGNSTLSYIIDNVSADVGNIISLSGGDEGNKQHHASGIIAKEDEPDNIEVRIDSRQKGIVINIWGSNPEIYSIGIVSPTGEVIPRIPVRINKSEVYPLIFDKTTVIIEYDYAEESSGDELIILKLEDPTPGVWTIRLYATNILSGEYNIYLPISNFIYENTIFLQPNPATTIVDPAYAQGGITAVRFSPINGAINISNGRGYARDGAIKPDLATPTSVAILAGAVCQFLTWGIVNENDIQLKASDVKSFLIRGARRNPDLTYPNRESGYGYLDIYEAFQRLRGL